MSEDEAPQPPPLNLEHGRQIAGRIVQAHRDVQATKATTKEILERLTPDDSRPSPTLQSLELIIQTLMQHTQALTGLDRRLERIEKALRIGPK